ITDSSNPANVYDTSNSTFEVRGALNITQPDASGIVLTYDRQATYNINWTKAGGIATVNLLYATDGASFTNTIVNNLSAVASPYVDWVIPDAIGTNLKVKVRDSTNAAVNDSSTNAFAIKGSMLVTYPNGNEGFVKGSTQPVNWTPTGSYPGSVNIYYSNDSGGNWTLIGSASAGADNVSQSWNWTPVPDDIGDTAMIKVATNASSTINVSDTSNATFRVKGSIAVTEPNGNEVWYVNDTNRQIKWTAAGTVTPVKIEYSTDSGGNWTVLTNTYSGVDGANIYNWTPVPDLKSEQCLIKVSDNRTAFSDVSDTSNATFSIRPIINVTQPVSGQNVVVSSTITPIRWTYTGSQISSVNIQYALDGGVNWTTIETSVPVAYGTNYTWPLVPAVKTSSALIKVYDTTNANITDDSYIFNIVGSLKALTPNGNENWAAGSTQWISWSATQVSSVQSYYSLNNGTNWTPIGSAVPASDGGVNWSISNTSLVSNVALVKVEDTSNPSVVNDTSNATFAVMAYLDITAPESGVPVIAEEPYNITWNKKGNGVDNVIIEYRTNDTSSWINAANASDPNATVPNLGTYFWSSVPGTILSNYAKVRIYDPNNLNTTNEGTDYFPIRGNISVAAPNGGQIWGVGTTENITWTKQGNISTVDIKYSYDNGSYYNVTLASGLAASNLSWQWTIGNATTLAAQGKIKIQDSSDPSNVFDISDSPFEVRGRLVVNTPSDANITLKVNEGYNITWTPYGAIQYVNLSYSTDGLNPPWTSIISNLSAAPSVYTWTVPDAILNTIRVRVGDTSNPNVVNYSSNDFRIIGKVRIVKPNLTETDWVVGSSKQIQWTPTGNFSFVKIEGSTNGFSDENQTWYIDTVDAGLSGELQVYNYSPVGDKISANAKIRVSDSLRQSEVYSVSTDPFKIKGKLEVISPTAGTEEWTSGTQPTSTPIQWQRTGSIANIKIEYSPNMGTDWYEVTNSTDASAGAFSNWTIPDSAVRSTKQALIKITDVTEPSVNDTSNNTFLIKGAYNLTAPNTTGQGLLVNNTYNVTWTKTGVYTPTDTVKIQYSKNDGAYQSIYNVLNQSADSVDASQGYFQWYVPDDLSSNIKIKLTRNADTVNIAPIISPQIKIVGSLLVTPSPPEGAKWEVNKTYPIQWTRQGSISNVSISYSTNGQNYTFIDYADGSSGGVGYNWLIPNTAGVLSTNATIKVADTSDPATVFNISPVFSIIPRFIIATPTLNQKVNASRDTDITWNSYGWNSYVNIYYSTNNFTGGNGTVLIQGNATNNGSYTWPVPDVLTNSIKVRVAYPADESAYNDSDVFRIVPGYEVVAPYSSTADKWQVGRIHQIKWNSTSANAPNVKLYYSINSGQNYTYLIDSNASNAGAVNATRVYNWSVNDTITSGFKVKVQDADAGRSDISAESPFNSKIMGYLNITYPESNQTFTVNDNFNITWDRSGTVPEVKLEISKDDFNTSTVINGSTTNDGNYSWIIPDLISDTVRVKVSDVNDTTDAYSVSENYFKVRGSFNVTSPADGERLPIGYNATLQWDTGGNISRVRIVAYSSIGNNDTRFNYTASSPYVINGDYSSNVGNGQTNYTWLVPDNATAYAKIRVSDYNDSNVYADSAGNFSLIGSFNVTAPNGAQAWIVGTTQNITWVPTGSSITEAKISYSVNGLGGPWYNITDTWNNTTDGIVNNTGSYPWIVPDVITPNFTAYIKIGDPYDASVNDTSDSGFKIRGNFNVSSPGGTERWVTNENRTVSWNTVGSVGTVNILYSRDNFTTSNISISNLSSASGSNNYTWKIPDPVQVYGINATSLPISVRVRVIDANDSSIYADSAAFTMDYYNITWNLRDFLSSLPITGGLSVNDSSGWMQSGLSSPTTHKAPYGNWEAAWTHKDYGDSNYKYLADQDQSITIYLESKVVHVWEASTDFVYDTGTDKLSFKSYLVRDGSIAGSRDANGTFNTIASNCSIEVYNAAGTLLKELNTTSVSSAGFFSIDWASTGLNKTLSYNAITQIETSLGGKFRTPFSINLAPITSLYNATSLISERIDMPISAMQANMTLELSNQTQLIETKMDQQIGIIENKTAEMQTSVNQTLSSFENRTYAAIADLQAGANQTINASEQALSASAKLEATAKKYSWSASVSPNPALLGDKITLTCQGEANLLPLLTIYSWDNKAILKDQFLTETTLGLYEYEFEADSRFSPGKAYTYVVTEQVTSGMVAGSGVVESMSITTVAGLAAAAPEAERAAKKALDAIKAVEAMMSSGEQMNIALALKNLQNSVEELPAAIAREGPAAKLNEAVTDISTRLQTLVGEQGYDMGTIFEKALSGSPTIKEIRTKTDEIGAAGGIMLEIMEKKLGGTEEPFISMSLSPGSVIFRLVAVNPSKVKKQKIEIKSYLPLEVKPKDILEATGLKIEYDMDKSLYYAYNPEVELAPGEMRVFKVEVEDIWIIPENTLSDLKAQSEDVARRLEKTSHAARAKTTAENIAKSCDEIKLVQADESLSRSQHIGIYRQNVEIVERMKSEIEELEKLLKPSAGPVPPEVLEKSKLKIGMPTKTTTWLIIIIVLIFLGMLAAVFFFVMQAQIRAGREVIKGAKDSAFPGKNEDNTKEQKSAPDEKK
ncbi:MAG TPA: hypothetical protein DCL49_10390, partial [Candidatus Omnitrophica bacterium]|nr:hypothetical protein [Candidatus Omnitrophota bacterium]